MSSHNRSNMGIHADDDVAIRLDRDDIRRHESAHFTSHNWNDGRLHKEKQSRCQT